jgi:hypothetical protein
VLFPIFLVALNAHCLYLVSSASLLGRYRIKDFKKFSKIFLSSQKDPIGCCRRRPTSGSGVGFEARDSTVHNLLMKIDNSGPASVLLVG